MYYFFSWLNNLAVVKHIFLIAFVAFVVAVELCVHVLLCLRSGPPFLIVVFYSLSVWKRGFIIDDESWNI